MRRMWLTFSIFALAALVPASSLAGYATADFASCTKEADGTGYCRGTLRGFRKSPGANDQANFNVQGALVSFSASLNGKSYACVFNGSAAAVDYRLFAMGVTQTNGFFLIAWGPDGLCATNGYAHGSSYTSYP